MTKKCITFGIALSTYSRIDDVLFNVKLMREIWKYNSELFKIQIHLCHNNPKMKKEFEAIDGLDSVIEAPDLPFTNKAQLRCRQVSCWQTGIAHALAQGCDVVTHYHADAYALKPDWMLEHVECMLDDDFEADITGRGYGLTHYGAKVPYGDIDDHFFFVTKNVKSDSSFFEPPDVSLMTKLASEGYLAHCIQKCIKDDNLLFMHYDDLSNNEHGRITRAMHPFNYDAKRFLLHTPDSDIRDKFMKQVYDNC